MTDTPHTEGEELDEHRFVTRFSDDKQFCNHCGMTFMQLLAAHDASLKAKLLAAGQSNKHHIESDRNIAYREGFNDANAEWRKAIDNTLKGKEQ